MGLVADKLGRLRVLRVSSFLLAVNVYVWYFCNTLASLLVFGGFYGFVSGAIITVMGPLCAEFFGLDNLTAMMGIVFSGAGLGMLLGPPIAGYVFDITDSYTIAILFGGTAMLVGSFLFFILKKPKKDHSDTETVVERTGNLYGSVRADSGSQTYIPAGSADWKSVKVLSPIRSASDSSLGLDEDLLDSSGLV